MARLLLHCRKAVSSGELLTIAHSGICLAAFDGNKCRQAAVLQSQRMEIIIASYGDSARSPRGRHENNLQLSLPIT